MSPVTQANMPRHVAHGTRHRYLDDILHDGLVPGGPFAKHSYVNFTTFPPHSGGITGLPHRAE
eukprot:3844465-Lingulodinium_polyedra.AAC.1